MNDSRAVVSERVAAPERFESHDVRHPVITGVAFFASGRNDSTARRPTDAALAISSGLLLVATAMVSTFRDGSDGAAAAVVRASPDIFEPLWRVGYVAAFGWALVVIGAAIVRRRGALVRNIALAAVVAFAIGALASRVVNGHWPSLGDIPNTGGPPFFPALLVALTAAILSTASPHLARPFRHTGRWLLVLQFFGALFLSVGLPTHVVGGLAAGVGAAAMVHLLFGSPGGVPTDGRIRLALADLGLHVEDLRVAQMQRQGVVVYDAQDASGPVVVKVYGRDAWDAQLMTSLWRALAYRNSSTTIVLRRVQQVEHEAFVTLLAERAGVPVDSVVTAGSAGRGDALLVLRPSGTPFADLAADDIDDAALRGTWKALARLHAIDIVHGRLAPPRLVLGERGAVLADFSAASVGASVQDELKDRAQLLVATTLCTGADRALDAARADLGDAALADVMSYVQPAALPPELLERVKRANLDLDALREQGKGAPDAQPPALVRLRRVSGRSLLNVALLLIATLTILAAMAGVDWSSVADAFADADWWWLVAALVIAQLARASGCFSTFGASPYPLPPGPTTEMQFAISYVNLAIPSTAARVAVNIRYFTRVGVPAAVALAIGALDGIAGFVVQIMLLLLLPLVSDANTDFDLDVTKVNGAATIALIAIGIFLLAAVALMVSNRLRAWTVKTARTAAHTLRVLRSPSKLTLLFGGNALTQVLFGIAIAATLRGFHVHESIATLVMINTFVSLFAGLLPIPGGIGVAEAGLVWGFTSVGIDQSIALAAALAYRVVSFYLPPVWGYFTYQSLTKRGYL
jgi:glycosyltransferase 2 family protein